MAGDGKGAANGTAVATQPVLNGEHEAVLTGVVALANLFGNCVEAFGLIHPVQKWQKEEQLLLCRLGIQQARLLIWGDVTGACSPPASVTDRAVPKHPSAAYPDLKEPTFFNARDPRLDEPETRVQIEAALTGIMDRSSATASKDYMEKEFGLRPPKKFATEYQPALDNNRLEAFRERYALLKEVAETYARINARKDKVFFGTSYQIADFAKFEHFLKLTQENIDTLINLMDIKDRVDRAMRMDIRAFGWHLSADRQRIALDVSKLRLMSECCKEQYPEYIIAVDQALENIDRERRENVGDYNPYASSLYAPVSTPRTTRGRGSISAQGGLGPENGTTNGATSPTKEKRPSLFGKLFGRKSSSAANKGRSLSVAAAGEDEDDPERSLSDVGPFRPDSSDSMDPGEQPLRSKSVGAILETPAQTVEEQKIKDKLERLQTNDTVDEPLEESTPISSSVSRHDQYSGLGRQGTKNQ